jgi:hypothetical protein
MGLNWSFKARDFAEINSLNLFAKLNPSDSMKSDEAGF